MDPVIVTRHPVSQLVPTGAETATFKIEATGDDLAFQWQKNGSDLHSDRNYSGTDTNTLKIQHVKKSDAGHYRCLVKNQVEKDGKLSTEAELAVCKLDAVKCIVDQLLRTCMGGHVPGCTFDFYLRKSLCFTLYQFLCRLETN